MSWVQRWREIFLLVFVVLAILFIHPFNTTGMQVSNVNDPASQVLHVNDIITSINGITINSRQDFQDVVSGISPNDTVTVHALRETYPYVYKTFDHTYVAEQQDNRTSISLTAKELQSTNIKFSHELMTGVRYTVTINGDVDKAIGTLSKRFSISRINSYSFEKAGGNTIYIYTLSGDEIIPFIESKGNFEAKIGNNTFFTNADMIKVCTSGVSCSISLYPYLNQSAETSQVLWKFGFDVSITNESSYRFVNLTKGLAITKCVSDRCILNESIDYYIDSKYIGSEDIYSDFKERPFPLPNVGGDALTQQDATQALYTAQALLQGQVDAKIVNSEEVSASFGPDFITIFILALVVFIIAGSAVILVLSKDVVATIVSILVGIGELVLIIGWMAVLNLAIWPVTLMGIATTVIFSISYKIFIIARAKKESMSKHLIRTLGSKVDKIAMIALCVFAVATFVIASFTVPLLFYFVTLLILSKEIFLRSIKTGT